MHVFQGSPSHNATTKACELNLGGTSSGSLQAPCPGLRRGPEAVHELIANVVPELLVVVTHPAAASPSDRIEEHIAGFQTGGDDDGDVR
jgi:hypothetical protein